MVLPRVSTGFLMFFEDVFVIRLARPLPFNSLH